MASDRVIDDHLTMDHVIEVSGLRKTYGALTAVDDLTFSVRRGEIFGLIGPNGAGKTTTVSCLEGHRRPDAGSVRVLGMEPARHRRPLARRLGVQLQESALPERLKVCEAMELFASFYDRCRSGDELLDLLGLSEKHDAYFGKLSGGQKQRLHIALALLHDPEVILLDELTTGLDPHARRSIWDVVEDLRRRERTVLLTTHFMEEAERLCDRVGVMKRGRLVALDTPTDLIRTLDVGRQIEIVFDAAADQVVDDIEIARLDGVDSVRIDRDRLFIAIDDPSRITRVVTYLVEHEVEIRELTVNKPGLEEVFLELTAKGEVDAKETT